jgi:hypothetical protein
MRRALAVGTGRRAFAGHEPSFFLAFAFKILPQRKPKQPQSHRIAVVSSIACDQTQISTKNFFSNFFKFKTKWLLVLL